MLYAKRSYRAGISCSCLAESVVDEPDEPSGWVSHQTMWVAWRVDAYPAQAALHVIKALLGR